MSRPSNGQEPFSSSSNTIIRENRLLCVAYNGSPANWCFRNCRGMASAREPRMITARLLLSSSRSNVHIFPAQHLLTSRCCAFCCSSLKQQAEERTGRCSQRNVTESIVYLCSLLLQSPSFHVTIRATTLSKKRIEEGRKRGNGHAIF